MIATAVVVVGSGLVRVFSVGFGMDFLEAIYANAGVLILVFAGLILYDLHHKKLSKNRSFVVALLVFAIPNLLIMYVPYTAWWQSFAEGIAKAIN